MSLFRHVAAISPNLATLPRRNRNKTAVYSAAVLISLGGGGIEGGEIEPLLESHCCRHSAVDHRRAREGE